MIPAVCIKDYSFKYQGYDDQVLHDINLSINYGDFVVISGFSGVGKTTLLASINGIIPHIFPGEQRGQIKINGIEINTLDMGRISLSVGSVLQEAESQIFNTTIDDEIAFGCENLKLPVAEISKRIHASCAFMDLDPKAATHTLSGGQIQRLVTASTLAMKQKILVMDEPLANLDVDGAQKLLGFLRNLTHTGYAVILVEHRLDVVLPYTDRLIWLENGRIDSILDQAAAFEKFFQLFDFESSRQTIQSQQPVFNLSHLDFSFGDTCVLTDFSLQINKGDRMVILGENGSGKTTLLRLLGKLLKPTSGQLCQYILQNKRHRIRRDRNWFKKVGYIYQNPNYQLFMSTVFDEVNYQSCSIENTHAYLELFNLSELADRHPHSLSEGQKRRLSIAAIAAMKPDVLLLDEPTVGQDYAGLANLLTSLDTIHAQNHTTIIIVTHDFRCAGAMGERIIWLKDGGIKDIGGPEIAQQYFTRYPEGYKEQS